MNLLSMAWKYIWARPLVSVLTMVSILLGTALVSSVLMISREVERTLALESGRYDLIVGAKGSPLQLILSSMYHLDIPAGNIPWSRYEALGRDRRIKSAVPIGLGDNYRGFRIVGTSTNFFDPHYSRMPDSAALVSLEQGRLFDQPFEVVLGSEVARQTGLQPGDRFTGAHGLVALPGSENHDEFPYHVVGVLRPAGMSIDRAVYTPIESVWQVHAHEDAVHRSMLGGSAESQAEDADREVTAVMLQLRAPGMRMWVAEEVNSETESMAAIPVNELARLHQRFLIPMQNAMLTVAAIVMLVSIFSMIATLYQSAERRRKDVAVLRMLGAHPREVFFLMVTEALVLVVMGIGFGLLLSHGGTAAVAGTVRASTGLVIQPLQISAAEIAAASTLGAAGIIAGVVAGAMGYFRVLSREVGG